MIIKIDRTNGYTNIIMSEKYQIQVTNFSKGIITLYDKSDMTESDIYTYAIKQLWMLNIYVPGYIFFRDKYINVFKKLHRISRNIINCALNARYEQCYNDNWNGLYSICYLNFPVDMAKNDIDILHEIYHFLNKIYQDNHMEDNIFAIDIIQGNDASAGI